jgi:hypothetical protein
MSWLQREGSAPRPPRRANASNRRTVRRASGSCQLAPRRHQPQNVPQTGRIPTRTDRANQPPVRFVPRCQDLYASQSGVSWSPWLTLLSTLHQCTALVRHLQEGALILDTLIPAGCWGSESSWDCERLGSARLDRATHRPGTRPRRLRLVTWGGTLLPGQHEGATPALGRSYRGQDPLRVRPRQVGRPARGRRQVPRPRSLALRLFVKWVGVSWWCGANVQRDRW